MESATSTRNRQDEDARRWVWDKKRNGKGLETNGCLGVLAATVQEDAEIIQERGLLKMRQVFLFFFLQRKIEMAGGQVKVRTEASLRETLLSNVEG